MVQELVDPFRRKMRKLNLIDFLMHSIGDKRNEQSQRMAVTALCIPRHVALTDKVLELFRRNLTNGTAGCVGTSAIESNT
jgi:hypothetical protein